MGRIVPRCALASIVVPACVLFGLGAGAAAQPLALRIVTSPETFTPLHAYAHGEVAGDIIFFSGISGMGLHNTSEGNGSVGFPFNTFNRQIHLYDPVEAQLYSGDITHLTTQVKERLTTIAPGFVQFGGILRIYGGYGPTEAQDNFVTHSSVTAIDLAVVREALRAGSPVPQSAFTVNASVDGQITGTKCIRNGSTFWQICGAYFTGDYGRFITPTFQTVYPNKVHVFNPLTSYTIPVQTFFTSASSSDPLRRRDMNALPATLPPQGGGVERRNGFVVLGGVFRLGAFVWKTPLSFADGDPSITHHTTFTQNMNQYEGPAVSFYSPTADTNRFVLLSGISSSTWNGKTFTDVFPQIPWNTEITELQMTGGVFQSETVIGAMPLPMVNAELFLNPLIPTNAHGQVLTDDMPANEVTLGRIYGGLRAAGAGNTPPTFASNSILEVRVVLGVRGDVSRDGTVSAADLALLLGSWGSSNTVSDLNLDGLVNSADLALLLGLWGNSTPG